MAAVEVSIEVSNLGKLYSSLSTKETLAIDRGRVSSTCPDTQKKETPAYRVPSTEYLPCTIEIIA